MKKYFCDRCKKEVKREIEVLPPRLHFVEIGKFKCYFCNGCYKEWSILSQKTNKIVYKKEEKFLFDN